MKEEIYICNRCGKKERERRDSVFSLSHGSHTSLIEDILGCSWDFHLCNKCRENFILLIKGFMEK